MNGPRSEGACESALEEVLGFCAAIERRMGEYGITQDTLGENADHADLILMPLCQIGEAVQGVRGELEERYPEMTWHQMAGLRNVIVHGYTKVDPGLIFSTVAKDIPRLRDFCRKVLGR